MEEKQTAQGTTAPAPPVPKPDVDDLIFTGQIGYISDRRAADALRARAAARAEGKNPKPLAAFR